MTRLVNSRAPCVRKQIPETHVWNWRRRPRRLVSACGVISGLLFPSVLYYVQVTLTQSLESDYTKSTPRQTKDIVGGVASPDTCVYCQAGVREGTYERVRGRDDGVLWLKQGGGGNL